jgi:uncharacterized protein (TIGR00730 family)
MAVYCGHEMGSDPQFAKDAEKLGIMMAENKIRLVFGAGDVGLMGAVARAAKNSGGELLAVTTPHIIAKQEPAMPGLPLEIKDTLLERKARMIEASDAFCILPGGMGTLDEVTDILTMHQIGESIKPVYFLNTNGYWNVFGDMIKQMIKFGFVSGSLSDFNIHIFSTPEDVIAAYNARFFG